MFETSSKGAALIRYERQRKGREQDEQRWNGPDLSGNGRARNERKRHGSEKIGPEKAGRGDEMSSQGEAASARHGQSRARAVQHWRGVEATRSAKATQSPDLHRQGEAVLRNGKGGNQGPGGGNSSGFLFVPAPVTLDALWHLKARARGRSFRFTPSPVAWTFEAGPPTSLRGHFVGA